ncbi:MAG: radical SAM protein [Polyangiales bacterium]
MDRRRLPLYDEPAYRGGPAGAVGTWPLDVDRFTALYLGAPPPVTLPDGWTLLAAFPGRVRPGVELHARHPDWGDHVVDGERRSSLHRMVATRHLNLSARVPRGAPEALDRSLRALTYALGRRFAARDADATVDIIDALFTQRGRSERSRRPAEVRINRECNERCLFCNTPEDSDVILSGEAEVREAVARGRREGCAQVTFTGREPTLDPRLDAYVRLARDLGYKTIEVQTNATAFSSPTFTHALHASGLNAASVSLHTFEPATFERLVGPAHLLDKALRGVDALTALPGFDCGLLFVMTAHNLDELPDFIDRVADRWGERVSRVVLSAMAPVGDGARHLDVLAPLHRVPAVLDEALRRAAARGAR